MGILVKISINELDSKSFRTKATLAAKRFSLSLTQMEGRLTYKTL